MKRTPDFLTVLAAVMGVHAAACGGSSSGRPTDGGSGGREDARTRDAAADAGTAEVGCARFKFRASGTSCGTSCGPFSCSCPGDFPKSLTKCTSDGCLSGGDCAAVCAADLREALDCTDEYTVGLPDAGTPDAGPPLLTNGETCSADAACASGRCATGTESRTCVAGAPGDACSAPRGCISGICNAQVCGAWTPTRGGNIAITPTVFSELRVLPDGYTVAGNGTAVSFGAGAIDSARTLFLAEFADDGTHRSTVFAKSPNTTGELHGVRLPDGSRRLAGDFYTSWQAGSTQLTPVYSGNANLFVSSFDKDGAALWAKAFGITSSQGQRIVGLAVDGAGASYLIGDGRDIDFGAGAVTRTPFLAKLNADGGLGWAKAFDGESAQGEGLAIDPLDGALVWSGVNQGLDKLALDGTNATVDGFGIFLARFSATGEHIWSKGFKSFGPSARVAVGSKGEIVMAGSFRTNTSFGGETFDDVGGEDVFVARFSTEGDHLWSRAFGGSGTDRALTVAVDDDGGVAIGGIFSKTADLGTGPVTVAGEWDGFVARLSPTGEPLSLRLIQGPYGDEVRSLAFSAQGLLVGGNASGMQDFGKDPEISNGGFVMVLPR